MTERVRVTVNLPKEDVDALRAIADRRGFTMTETLRRAIAMERFVEEVATDGGTLVVEEKDKTLRRVLIR